MTGFMQMQFTIFFFSRYWSHLFSSLDRNVNMQIRSHVPQLEVHKGCVRHSLRIIRDINHIGFLYSNMLLLADILTIVFFTAKAEDQQCTAYGTDELLYFFKEGDISIGGIFSFHQNPGSINSTLLANPGNIRCYG